MNIILVLLKVDEVVRVQQNDWVIIGGISYHVELDYVVGRDPHLRFLDSEPTNLEEEEACECVMQLAEVLVDSAKFFGLPTIHA